MARSSINVASLRKHIDALDVRLVRMLNERARLAQRIGHLKKVRGEAIYDPERESYVLSRIVRVNKGPLTDSALGAVYREIMATALALECDFEIAIPRAHAKAALRAARRCYGGRIGYVACKDIAAICRAVQSGRAMYGLVPGQLALSPAGCKVLKKAMASSLRVSALVSDGNDTCVLISARSAGSVGDKAVMLLEMSRRGNSASSALRDVLRKRLAAVVRRRGNSVIIKSKGLVRSAATRNLERMLKRGGFTVTVLGSCPA